MKSYSTITPYISEMAALSDGNNGIVSEMYAKHKVNRGFRDMSGNGVVISGPNLLEDGKVRTITAHFVYHRK